MLAPPPIPMIPPPHHPLPNPHTQTSTLTHINHIMEHLTEAINKLQCYVDVAQLLERRTGTPLGEGSIPRSGKEFFSRSRLSVQTLTVSVHLRVQRHALTSVRTLKIL